MISSQKGKEKEKEKVKEKVKVKAKTKVVPTREVGGSGVGKEDVGRRVTRARGKKGGS